MAVKLNTQQDAVLPSGLLSLVEVSQLLHTISDVRLAHRTFFTHKGTFIAWRQRLAVGPNVAHMARAAIGKVDLYQAGLPRRI